MPKPQKIRVKDLPNQTGNEKTRGIILFCDECLGEYSANKGDYFSLSDNKIMKCCNQPLRLVRKVTTLEDITPGSWEK